jgi:hypothetical protein
MEPPIGRHLYWIARITQKAFNDALESAGSSLPASLILLHVEKIWEFRSKHFFNS